MWILSLEIQSELGPVIFLSEKYLDDVDWSLVHTESWVLQHRMQMAKSETLMGYKILHVASHL